MTYTRKQIPVEERILKRTKIPKDKTQCWLWCGPVNNAGYGMIRGDKGVPKMTTVHRAMGVVKGLDTVNYEVQHTCLNKICVNPQHLIEGNVKDRTRRLIKKYGRHFQRPKNPYITCEHCGGVSYVTWFKRIHGECYTYIPKNKV